jgi:hypothetical protein
MVYVVMFDFALAALVIAGLGFFVSCWIAFGKERIRRPIYRGFAVPNARNAAAIPIRKHCA